MKLIIGQPKVLASGYFPDIAPPAFIYKDSQTRRLILMRGSESTAISQEPSAQHPRLSIVDDKLLLAYESNGQIFLQNVDSGPKFLGDGFWPGRIVRSGSIWLMAYYVREGNQSIQMVARSSNGESWRDRTTVASNGFCEGCIVPFERDKLICYMSDSHGARSRAQVCLSLDNGLSWSAPSPLAVVGRQFSAAVKTRQPYAGLILATFKNPTDRSLSLMIQNYHRKNVQIFALDTESHLTLDDFGYANWIETEDGGIEVIYQIRRSHPLPVICSLRVDFQ